MKIKRSLVVLNCVIALCIALPAVAFAATDLPDTLPALEQLHFTPLLYTIVLLCAVLLCLVIVALVQVYRFREKRVLIGQGLFELRDILTAQGEESTFDYSQIETPDELNGNYSAQTDLVVEEAINRLCREARYVPRHRKELLEQEGQQEGSARLPHIRLVPEMKHARRKTDTPLPPPVPNELEALLRKIS